MEECFRQWTTEQLLDWAECEQRGELGDSDDWLVQQMGLKHLYDEKIQRGHTMGPDEVYLREVSPEVGVGVFAKRLLKRGEFIGEYTGLVQRHRREIRTVYNCHYVAIPYPESGRTVRGGGGRKGASSRALAAVCAAVGDWADVCGIFFLCV